MKTILLLTLLTPVIFFSYRGWGDECEGKKENNCPSTCLWYSDKCQKKSDTGRESAEFISGINQEKQDNRNRCNALNDKSVEAQSKLVESCKSYYGTNSCISGETLNAMKIINLKNCTKAAGAFSEQGLGSFNMNNPFSLVEALISEKSVCRELGSVSSSKGNKEIDRFRDEIKDFKKEIKEAKEKTNKLSKDLNDENKKLQEKLNELNKEAKKSTLELDKQASENKFKSEKELRKLKSEKLARELQRSSVSTNILVAQQEYLGAMQELSNDMLKVNCSAKIQKWMKDNGYKNQIRTGGLSSIAGGDSPSAQLKSCLSSQIQMREATRQKLLDKVESAKNAQVALEATISDLDKDITSFQSQQATQDSQLAKQKKDLADNLNQETTALNQSFQTNSNQINKESSILDQEILQNQAAMGKIQNKLDQLIAITPSKDDSVKEPKSYLSDLIRINTQMSVLECNGKKKADYDKELEDWLKSLELGAEDRKKLEREHNYDPEENGPRGADSEED